MTRIRFYGCVLSRHMGAGTPKLIRIAWQSYNIFFSLQAFAVLSLLLLPLGTEKVKMMLMWRLACMPAEFLYYFCKCGKCMTPPKKCN